MADVTPSRKVIEAMREREKASINKGADDMAALMKYLGDNGYYIEAFHTRPRSSTNLGTILRYELTLNKLILPSNEDQR